MYIPKESLPANNPIELRFRSPWHSHQHDCPSWAWVIAQFAKPGKVYAVVRLMPNGHRRMRLYAVKGSGLCRIDQLVNKELFYQLLAEEPHDAEKIYNTAFSGPEFEASGFGWPANSYSNVALGIIYGLAKLVHGDRKAWTVEFL
jgi:hypothetical protein